MKLCKACISYINFLEYIKSSDNSITSKENIHSIKKWVSFWKDTQIRCKAEKPVHKIMNMILSHQRNANEFYNEMSQYVLERLTVKRLTMPNSSVDVEQVELSYITDWKAV